MRYVICVLFHSLFVWIMRRNGQIEEGSFVVQIDEDSVTQQFVLQLGSELNIMLHY